MTLPSSVETAIASYPSLTFRLGQSSDSAISSGVRHWPAAVSSGPTMPPLPPTLWHELQLCRGSRNTSAPRRGSPPFLASSTRAAIAFAWSEVSSGVALLPREKGTDDRVEDGPGGTGVTGFGGGPAGLPSSWGRSQSSPFRLSRNRASASSIVWPRMPIGPLYPLSRM